MPLQLLAQGDILRQRRAVDHLRSVAPSVSIFRSSDVCGRRERRRSSSMQALVAMRRSQERKTPSRKRPTLRKARETPPVSASSAAGEEPSILRQRP